MGSGRMLPSAASFAAGEIVSYALVQQDASLKVAGKRIRLYGICQLDLRHDMGRRVTLVDLVHETNLFCQRMVRGKALAVSDLVECVGDGMLQKRIHFSRTTFQK